jgi:hypothetical protein
VRFLCCEVKQISKVKVKCFVRVLGAGARCWSILQPKAKLISNGLVSCRVLSKGAGLSYNQKFGAVGGCGAGISYIQALAWCLAWC